MRWDSESYERAQRSQSPSGIFRGLVVAAAVELIALGIIFTIVLVVTHV